MLKEAIFHRPKLNWAYAYDEQTIHIRVRTKRDDVGSVSVWFGDKFMPVSTMQLQPMSLITSDDLFDYWQVEVIPIYRRLVYGFQFKNSEGELWLSEKGFQKEKLTSHHSGLFDFPFLNPVDVFKPPAWVKDAVFYQIFPERFANGDPNNDPDNVQPWGHKPTPHNYFGGDLQGIINHLDHLTELGVNAIYFNPLFAANTNHKYDTSDYLKVDPHFGTNETLKALVTACHQRGIRVMLDAVFNHCGAKFAPFVDVLEKGAQSPYAKWFHVKEFPLAVKDRVPTYDTFAFEPHMPKLNTEHPQVKKYLLDVATYWIEEVGIDGWRLDVANEVDHQFWREFRQAVKQINPDIYILGEIFHDAMMWLQGDQFDAVMNYPFSFALLDFFAKRQTDASQFVQALSHQLMRYPQQANEVAFNLLNSHDTERLLTMCGNDPRRMKLAATFQLTYMGTPCIYYGDEIGLTGGYDPDCRKCMVWDPSKQDQDLFTFYQQMIALRNQYSALRTGSFRFLLADAEDYRIAYERVDTQGHFIIMMNVSTRKRNITLKLPVGLWQDVFSANNVQGTGKRQKFELPAFGYSIYRCV